MLNITKPYIGVTEYLNVLRVITSGKLSSGRWVKSLENVIAKETRTKCAVAVSNGTTALHLALLAARVGRGDEVITTPFTFIATTNAILMCGATPVFVDIDPQTYCISASNIKNSLTKKTKAVLAVNLYGNVCDYDEIRNTIPNNTLIIEDAAQSIGGEYKNKKSGSLGDLATFSLYATKNIMTGEGGVITTNHSKHFDLLVRLRQHGMTPRQAYSYEMLGYNYRMTEISASLGVAQLSRLDKVTSKRRQLAKRYDGDLKGIKGLECFVEPKYSKSVYHQYPIRITDKAKMGRDELKNELSKKGIATAIYYPKVLYQVDHISRVSRYSQCVEAEKCAEQLLCLPIHPALAEDDQLYIIDTINQLLR